MSEYEGSHDSEDQQFLEDVMDIVRADAPDQARWRVARTKLMEQLETRQTENRIMTIIRVAHSTRTGLIATVSIATAVTVLVVGFLIGNQGTSVAFADVAEAVANIRTATCAMNGEREGPELKTTTTGRFIHLAPSHDRCEFSGTLYYPDGSTLAIPKRIYVQDYQKGKEIVLTPKNKAAEVRSRVSTPFDGAHGWLQELRRMVSDAQRGEANEAENLGRQMVDGHERVGFRIRKGSYEYTIWAEPDTGLPAGVESISNDRKSRLVWSDFRYNVDLDESLFSLEVPEGYRVIHGRASATSVKHVAQMLRVAAEYNDGEFPAQLFGPEGIQAVLEKSVAAKHGSDIWAEKPQALADLNAKVSLGERFLRALAPEHVPRYAGKGVKLDTPNRPIFWYKAPEGNRFWVIYADLSTKEDVAAPRGLEDIPYVDVSIPETAPKDQGGRTSRRASSARK